MTDVINQEWGVAIAVVATRVVQGRMDLPEPFRWAVRDYIAEWNVAIGTADQRSEQARTRLLARDLTEDERLTVANAILVGRSLINRAQEALASA